MPERRHEDSVRHDHAEGRHTHDMHAGHAATTAPAVGPSPSVAGSHGHHGHVTADYGRRLRVSLLLTLPILILSPAIQRVLGLGEVLRFEGAQYLLFAFSSAIFFFGGYPFLKGFAREARAARPGMMTLISIAITTAYCYSSAVVFGVRGKVFFWELSTLVDIMLLGHWVELRSVLAASRALEELARLMPSAAHKLMPDGGVRDVPLEDLALGDRVIVKPGEKMPADGAVVEGNSSASEALLTGESTPVPKKPGSPVIGGSINGEGAITVEVKKTGRDSFLSQVIDLVRAAQESKSRTQDLADRAAGWLTLAALGGGGLTLAMWLGLSNQDFSFALERTVTVMVIACPHALGLAVPLVVAVSTSLAAGRGLLIRNRAAFERARNIKAVIFDKTGTLTEGRFGVTDVIPLAPDLQDKQILAYAAAVESRSEHPIARSIATAVGDTLAVEGFRAIPGKGAEGTVQGVSVGVVSPGYLREKGVEVRDQRVENALAQGKTVVFVMIDGDLKGAIALADVIRPESRAALAGLKRLGIKCMMVTGDNKQVAEWVSREVGLDEYFAEVLPRDKVSRVREIQDRGLVVAMTGDGVNDAPALAQADVGIAIGAGTDVAVETADIVLVKSNPADVAAILELSRATYRKMVQNLIWAAGYNVIAIPLAAGVLYTLGILLTPAMGAVFMSLSTVIVSVNARTLKLPVAAATEGLQ